MVHNKDGRVTTSYFFSEGRLLLEYSFEPGVVVFDISDRLS